jgi:hypothetical protein
VDDYDGDEPTGDLQMLVHEDTQRIMAYGHEHPSEYGGSWLNRADRTYGVSFTGSLEQHEAALGSTLNLPERLRVRRSLYSFAELQEVCVRLQTEDWDLSDLDDEGRPAINGFGPNQEAGVVQVRVQSGRPDISVRLVAKYGSRIVIEEGDWVNVAFA